MKSAILILVISAASFLGCQETERPAGDQGEKHEGPELPVWVSTVRDNRSKVIRYQMKDGIDKILWLVPGRGSEKNAVYLNQAWNEPGATPLPPEEIEKCFSEIEELLKAHYGSSALDDLVLESDRFDKMTVEERVQKFEDPIFVQKIDAANAVFLMKGFRGSGYERK